MIDDGAEKALLKGKSLLPVGIKKVEGNFDKGTVVQIINKEEKLLAKGISTYSSEEIIKLRGYKSEEIEKLLGYKYDDVVIHIDNMITLV